MPAVDLQVVTPERWKHYGNWRAAEPALDNGFKLVAAPISLPWIGPAQNYFHWYPMLRQILQDFRPDVIDLWEEPWGCVSAHACFLRNRFLPQARIISETEQNICKRLPPPFEFFRRFVLKHADFAVGRNDEAIEVLKKRGYRGEAEVVPNGVDVDLFTPMDKSACRSKLGVSGFVVGYVGRLVSEKGLADLIAALPDCDAAVNVLMVGSGPEEQSLREQAEKLGCPHRFRILPGMRLEELPAVMNALDCLVLPSRTTGRWREQFGRVLIEAGACGMPVIGSDSGAIPSTVGDAGLIFQEGDAKALAATIELLRKDVALQQKLGSAGRRRAVSRFSWEQVANQMNQIYQRVLESPRRSVKIAING